MKKITQLTTLSQARSSLSATSVGKYALFGGGWFDPSPKSDRVDIWNSENNTWSNATLSLPRSHLSATSVGKYALFGGGESLSYSNGVDILNISSDSQTTNIPFTHIPCNIYTYTI